MPVARAKTVTEWEPSDLERVTKAARKARMARAAFIREAALEKVGRAGAKGGSAS